MVAEHVELALLEDTFVAVGGLLPPFSDRISSIAARTRGILLFDIRVFGDASVERIAAIAYGEIGTVIAAATRQGDIQCTAVDDAASEYVCALTTWAEMPMPSRAATDYMGVAALLLATLRDKAISNSKIE